MARASAIKPRRAKKRGAQRPGAGKDLREELRCARLELKEALEQQAATAEILSVISATPTDVQPVFDAIARTGVRLFRGVSVTVRLVKGDRNERVAFAVGPGSGVTSDALGLSVPLADNAISGRAILRRKLIHVEDVDTVDWLGEVSREVAKRMSYRAVATAPMLRDGMAIGAIGVNRAAPGPFSDRELALLTTFADQAVIAIENARLFNESKEALEQQTATAEILKVISSSPADVQPVFEAIVQSGIRLFPGAAVAVALPDAGQVRVAAIAEADPARAVAWRSRFPFPLARDYMHGAAILDARLVDVPDAREAPPGLEVGCRNFLASGYRAATMVPMIRGGAAIGAISVLRLAPGALSAKQLALLKTFADQAVIAIENVRLLNETRDALERQTSTAEILKVISGSPSDVQPVFDAIIKHSVRLVPGSSVNVSRVVGDQLELVAYTPVSPAADEILRNMYPIAMDVVRPLTDAVRKRSPFAVTDFETEPGVGHKAREVMRARGFRSTLYIPIVHRGVVHGVMHVSKVEPGPFPQQWLELLKTFADQAAIAIENARLFNETREALEQQRALAEVLGVISNSIADTKPVFDKILASCQRLFEGHLVGVTLVGEDGKIHLGAYEGPHAKELLDIYPLPLSADSGSGAAILEGAVQHYPDIEAAEVPDGVRRGCRAAGMKSIIFAPLINEGRGIGALWVGRRGTGAFSEKRIALLKTFADQAVIAIQNARLLEEIRDKSRQVEIANRHKSEFLANMSHELRTPLNAIIGFTRIVQRNAQERLEPKQLENLEKILASGQHLLALINAILDLSKVEAGRIEVNAAEVALAPVLEQCLRTVEPLVKADAVTLVKDFDGALPAMLVDEEKLRQIVINLLSNAAKFTARGRIRLQARAADGSVAIAVADTGIGIAPDKLGLIFEEFQQADASSTRVHGGTGLGLTIARRLAHLMGGDIGVESAPGSGSTFTLTLPLRYSA